MWDHFIPSIDEENGHYFLTMPFYDDKIVCDSFMWLNDDGSWTQSHTR